MFHRVVVLPVSWDTGGTVPVPVSSVSRITDSRTERRGSSPTAAGGTYTVAKGGNRIVTMGPTLLAVSCNMYGTEIFSLQPN